MAYKTCSNCSGGGKVMGMGMIQADCPACDGDGRIVDEVRSIKETKGYQSAKQRLQDSHPELSEEEAEEMLDDAFEKETSKKKKKDEKGA